MTDTTQFCTPDTHDWGPTPNTDTVTVRDQATGAAIGCLMPVQCARCGTEAEATWDLPQ